jgi:hypothetical protein
MNQQSPNTNDAKTDLEKIAKDFEAFAKFADKVTKEFTAPKNPTPNQQSLQR